MENHLKKEVAQYFSEKQDHWEHIYEEDKSPENLVYQVTDRKNEILKRIDQFSKTRSLKILDIGCGPGIILSELLQRGHHVCGIDISSKMVAAAKTNLEKTGSTNFGCLQSDAESLSFRNEYFDVIICAGVLSYLAVDTEGIKEMSRVLKHNGILLLTLPNIFRLNNVLDPYYYINKGVKFAGYKLFKASKKQTTFDNFELNKFFHIRKYFFNQLNKLLKKHGLHVKQTISLGYGPLTFWRKELLGTKRSIRLSRRFEKMARMKVFKFLPFFANHWVVCLEKSY